MGITILFVFICLFFSLIALLLCYRKIYSEKYLLFKKNEGELARKINEMENQYLELEQEYMLKQDQLNKLMIHEDLFQFFERQNMLYQAKLDILIDKYQDELCHTGFYKDFRNLKRQLRVEQYQGIHQIIEKCDSRCLKKIKEKMPTLSEEEVLLIVLINYKCPVSNICAILGVTEMTLNKRKSRLKQKILTYCGSLVDGTGTLKSIIQELMNGYMIL